MTKQLTTKQRYWLDHIRAAQRSGSSYSRYAASHDLNLKALYNWRMVLCRKGLLESASPSFVELKAEPNPTPPQFHSGVVPSHCWAKVRLPNGVTLELSALNEPLVGWLASL